MPASPGQPSSASARGSLSKKRKLPVDETQAPKRKLLKSAGAYGQVNAAGSQKKPKKSLSTGQTQSARRPAQPPQRNATPGPSSVPAGEPRRTRSFTTTVARKKRRCSSESDDDQTPPPISSLSSKKSIRAATKSTINGNTQSTSARKPKTGTRRKSQPSTTEVIEIYDSDEEQEKEIRRSRRTTQSTSHVKCSIPPDCEVINLCSGDEETPPPVIVSTAGAQVGTQSQLGTLRLPSSSFVRGTLGHELGRLVDVHPVRPHVPLLLPTPTPSHEHVGFPKNVHVSGIQASPTPLSMPQNVADEENPNFSDEHSVIAESDSVTEDVALQTAIQQSFDPDPTPNTENSDEIDTRVIQSYATTSQCLDPIIPSPANGPDPDRASSEPTHPAPAIRAPHGGISAPVSRQGIWAVDSTIPYHDESVYSVGAQFEAAALITVEHAVLAQSVFSHPPVVVESRSTREDFQAFLVSPASDFDRDSNLPVFYDTMIRASPGSVLSEPRPGSLCATKRKGSKSEDECSQDDSPLAIVATPVASPSVRCTSAGTLDERKESAASPSTRALRTYITKAPSLGPSTENKDGDDENRANKITSDASQRDEERDNDFDTTTHGHADSHPNCLMAHVSHTPSNDSLISYVPTALCDVPDRALPHLTIKYSDPPVFIPSLLTPRFFAQSFLPPQREMDTSNADLEACTEYGRVGFVEVSIATVSESSAISADTIEGTLPADEVQGATMNQASRITTPASRVPSPWRTERMDNAPAAEVESNSLENSLIGAVASSQHARPLWDVNQPSPSPNASSDECATNQIMLDIEPPAFPPASSTESDTSVELSPLPPRETDSFFIRSLSPPDILFDAYSTNILCIPALGDSDDDDVYLLTHCFDYPDLGSEISPQV